MTCTVTHLLQQHALIPAQPLLSPSHWQPLGPHTAYPSRCPSGPSSEHPAGPHGRDNSGCMLPAWPSGSPSPRTSPAGYRAPRYTSPPRRPTASAGGGTRSSGRARPRQGTACRRSARTTRSPAPRGGGGRTGSAAAPHSRCTEGWGCPPGVGRMRRRGRCSWPQPPSAEISSGPHTRGSARSALGRPAERCGAGAPRYDPPHAEPRAAGIAIGCRRRRAAPPRPRFVTEPAAPGAVLERRGGTRAGPAWGIAVRPGGPVSGISAWGGGRVLYPFLVAGCWGAPVLDSEYQGVGEHPRPAGNVSLGMWGGWGASSASLQTPPCGPVPAGCFGGKGRPSGAGGSADPELKQPRPCDAKSTSRSHAEVTTALLLPVLEKKKKKTAKSSLVDQTLCKDDAHSPPALLSVPKSQTKAGAGWEGCSGWEVTIGAGACWQNQGRGWQSTGLQNRFGFKTCCDFIKQHMSALKSSEPNYCMCAPRGFAFGAGFL